MLKHHEYLGLSRAAFADYVEEISVPCCTPRQLLKQGQLKPEQVCQSTISGLSCQVDVLAIDAEGLDEAILKAFLEPRG